MITITLDQFKKILPKCKNPETWCNLLNQELPEHGIISRSQIAAFIAQTSHESADYNVLSENLNYSGERLLVVFPKYFKDKDVSKYNRNPASIANVVYANRMGNGDEASGEGYKFRGRGVLQVTGKANYMKCSEFLFGDDEALLHDPDMLLLPEHALGSALWYWSANNLANVINMTVLTKKINGGLHGQEDRQLRYDKAMSILTG